MGQKKDDIEVWLREKIEEIVKHTTLPKITISVSKGKNGDRGYIMETAYQKRYKRAVIFYYADAEEMFKSNREELYDSLVHEVSHIHTIPFSELALSRFATKDGIMDEAEEMTETVAQYIRKIIQLSNK